MFKTSHWVQCFSCLSCRYTLAILINIGLLVTGGFRCNIGIAMLDMREEFGWSPNIVGLIESAHSFGYIMTQVLGGYLATRVPIHRIFGICTVLSSCLNLLIPVCCPVHYSLVVTVRVIQGLVEGLAFPACFGIWREWAPPQERSRLVTLSVSGLCTALVIGMPLSGILTENLGWKSCFYFYGAFGLIWFIAWQIFVYETPTSHPGIKEEELIYIQKSIKEISQSHEPKETPWRGILTSMPVYAIVCCNFVYDWSIFFVIFEQPKFFKEVFEFDTSENGAYSTIPTLIMAILIPTGGYLADLLLQYQFMSTTTVRKIFTCGGFGMEALLLLAVSYISDKTLSFVCLTAAIGFCGLSVSGFNVNYLDLAPRYSSVLKGLSNTAGTIAGIIFPGITEHITENQTKSEWRTIFIIASLIHIGGVLFYAVFASGEKQPWADSDEKKQTELRKIETSQIKLNKIEDVSLSLGIYGSIKHSAG